MDSDSKYVTLISSDDFSFVVQRSSACRSGAIKRMLDPACKLLKRCKDAVNVLMNIRWFRGVQDQYMPIREHEVCLLVLFRSRHEC